MVVIGQLRLIIWHAHMARAVDNDNCHLLAAKYTYFEQPTNNVWLFLATRRLPDAAVLIRDKKLRRDTVAVTPVYLDCDTEAWHG